MTDSALPVRLLPHGFSAAWWKSNLAFALLCLPRSTRSSMLVFYQFCRVLDDLADDLSLPFHERSSRLALWKKALEGGCPLPGDLDVVIRAHAIPRELLLEIHTGVSQDLVPAPFKTRGDLDAYCRRVAVAVGLASNLITGCKTPTATDYAHNLGMALQLTNILRDVREDAAMGRVYFCDEDLEACGVTREEILQCRPGPGFAALWESQARRAASFFAAVSQGPPPADRNALRAAEIMRKLYASLLQKMCSDDARVWERRYRLSWAEKIRVVLR